MSTTIEQLLADRATHVAAVDKIDAELHRRGVRPIASVIGRPRDMAAAVTVLLSSGPTSARDIAAKTGQAIHAAQQLLSKMTLAGEARRVSRGVYALPEGAS